MRRLITQLCLLFVCCSLFAQRQSTIDDILNTYPKAKRYEGVYRYTPAMIPHIILSKSIPIDESQMRVIYDVQIIVDTLSGVVYKDRAIVQIGKTWYKTYGECMWLDHMGGTIAPLGPMPKEYERGEGYDVVINHVVYRNIKEKTIVNRAVLPEKRKIVFRYDEKQPEYTWVMTGKSKQILDYNCFQAITKYAGRTWVVWFTPEIPVDCGLWKFSGLPGLIMEAYDSKREYVFTSIGLSHQQTPIVKYGTKEKLMTREAFRKLEKNLHNDPIFYTQGNKGYHWIVDKSRNINGDVFGAGTILYPYNPIELE